MQCAGFTLCLIKNKIADMIRITLLFLLLSCMVQAQNNPDKEEWQQLFNGENLDGWDLKISGSKLNVNYKNTFEVRDGYLSVNYDEYDDFKEEFGHIFYREPFSYYRVGVEYRFIGDQVPNGPGWAFRNNGIMVHGQAASTMGLDQNFPYSIEVQLLGGNGTDKRSTANLCTPGTHVVKDGKLFTPHCVGSTSKTYHGDQWIRVEVLVLGDSLIQHFVEGELVMSYSAPQIGGGNVDGYSGNSIHDGTLLVSGTISLQAESHPTQFRKIEVLNLKGCMDEKAKNYKSYFIKEDNSICIY